MLVEGLTTTAPLYLVHWLKNNTVFMEYRCDYSPDYVIFMCNIVQYWGITLTHQNNLDKFE